MIILLLSLISELGFGFWVVIFDGLVMMIWVMLKIDYFGKLFC